MVSWVGRYIVLEEGEENFLKALLPMNALVDQRRTSSWRRCHELLWGVGRYIVCGGGREPSKVIECLGGKGEGEHLAGRCPFVEPFYESNRHDYTLECNDYLFLCTSGVYLYTRIVK